MKTTLTLQNLKCNGCANTIKSKLENLENISDIHIDVELSKVSFNCIDEENVNTVSQKLFALGYPPINETNSIITKAKSYVSCATGKFKD